MAGAFLILLREGFEAALVLGIIMAVLVRLGHPEHLRYVFLGALTALAASIGFAAVADGVSGMFDGAGQEVLNGVVLAAAAAMITYVMVWLRGSRRELESHLSAAVHRRAAGHGIGVFLLAFLAVFREGAESVLFLWGILAGGRSNAASLVTGAVLGLAVAVFIAWALFQGGRRVPLRTFFNVTTVLLVVLAAGMVSHAVGFWVAVDWLPALAYSVWDTSGLLPEGSPLGEVLAVLVGYNANPTLMEVLAYGTYLAGVGGWLWLGAGPSGKTSRAPAA
jgi:high-affinity iron transporter